MIKPLRNKLLILLESMHNLITIAFIKEEKT